MPITDLTNTTWAFKDTGIVAYGSGAMTPLNLSGTIDNVSWSSFYSPVVDPRSSRRLVTIAISCDTHAYIYVAEGDVQYSSVSDGEGWYYQLSGALTKLATPPTITITGGDNVENVTVIAWLPENAAQIHTITTVLTNISATGDITIEDGGEASVVLTPSKGLSLPSSISVVGASYAYIPSSGLVVLSNPTSDVTITASAVVSVDISTLDDYPSVTPGEHTLKIYTKANSYEDSDESTAVTFIKLSPPTTEVITSSVYTAEGTEYDTIYDLYAVDENGTIYYLGETLPQGYEYSVDSSGVLTLYNAPYTLSEGVVTIE